jgi:hypothetical protein
MAVPVRGDRCAGKGGGSDTGECDCRKLPHENVLHKIVVCDSGKFIRRV